MRSEVLKQMTWSDVMEIVEIARNVQLPADKPFLTDEEMFTMVLDQLKARSVPSAGGNENGGFVGECLRAFRELGYKPRWDPDNRNITFYYFGNKVIFYPKKQYFNGKGLQPGFGIEKLLEQLKEKPMPSIKKNV